MKTSRPTLWRHLPKFGLANRITSVALAVLLGVLLIPFVTWGQTSSAAATSATATTRSANMDAAASGPALPVDIRSSGLTTEDPTGGNHGVGIAPGLDDRISHALHSINMVWILIAGLLVMFMPLGFAMLSAGSCRAKNAGHTFAAPVALFSLAALGFWAYGFALSWGGVGHGPAGEAWMSTLGNSVGALHRGLGWGSLGDGGPRVEMAGGSGFFLSRSAGSSGTLALFFFMMAVTGAAVIIPAGAMAERWRWSNLSLYGLWGVIPLGLFANWMWGDGWLDQMGANWGMGHGAVDFGGSGVVHCMGGMMGLAGVVIIGPRIGKFLNGRARAMPGHNLPLAIAGALALSLGGMAISAGMVIGTPDVDAGVIVVNTALAGVTASIVAMLVCQWKFGKPDPSLMCSGLLAGLAAIAAPSAFVSQPAAVLIGAVAGVLVIYSVFFWDHMGVDDPVGAISVHGVCGFFGLISVGLFASGDYGARVNGIGSPVVGILPIGGGPHAAYFSGAGFSQLGAQLVAGAVCCVFGFVSSFLLFKITGLLIPMRISRETELQGLDIPELGTLSYPDFEVKTAQSVSDIAATTSRH